MTTLPQSRLAVSRRRRSERGAAMTEAAVFIPLFAVMFTGMAFIGHVYIAKMNAIRFARAYAWSYAVQNCAGTTPPRDPADGAEGNATAGSTPPATTTPGDTPVDTPGSDGLNNANADPDLQTLSQDNPALTQSSGNTSSSSGSTVKYSGAGWSPSQAVTSKTKMMCNEPRTETGILDVMKRAIKLASMW